MRFIDEVNAGFDKVIQEPTRWQSAVTVAEYACAAQRCYTDAGASRAVRARAGRDGGGTSAHQTNRSLP